MTLSKAKKSSKAKKAKTTKKISFSNEGKFFLHELYNNSDHIKNSKKYPQYWLDKSNDFVTNCNDYSCEKNVKYSNYGKRRVYDLFSFPHIKKNDVKDILVFVHGGFWHLFNKDYWSFMAKIAHDNQMHAVIPSYSLCPDVTLEIISYEISLLLEHIAKKFPKSNLHLLGHSAGGHLVARQVCKNSPLSKRIKKRIKSITPISGIFDLNPIKFTKFSQSVFLNDEIIANESPLFSFPDIANLHDDFKANIIIGAKEREGFKSQSKIFYQSWKAYLRNIKYIEVKNAHHFNIIEKIDNIIEIK